MRICHVEGEDSGCLAMNEFDRLDSTQCGESLMSLVTAIQFIDNLHMSPTTSAIFKRLKLIVLGS